MFDVVGRRKWFYIFSLAITIPGLLFILLTLIPGGRMGLQFSIAYRGGTEWTVQFANGAPEPAKVVQVLADNGLPGAEVLTTTTMASSTRSSGLPRWPSANQRRCPMGPRPRPSRVAPRHRPQHRPLSPVAPAAAPTHSARVTGGFSRAAGVVPGASPAAGGATSPSRASSRRSSRRWRQPSVPSPRPRADHGRSCRQRGAHPADLPAHPHGRGGHHALDHVPLPRLPDGCRGARVAGP